MKNLKNFFLLVMAMLMVLPGCSNAVVKNYDSTILEDATIVTAESGFDFEANPFAGNLRYFTVNKSLENDFCIDVNGTEMIIQLPLDNSSSEYQPSDVVELSSEHSKIVTKSQELVYQYIDTSTILKDKEAIKNYIGNLTVHEATFTDDDSVGAYFSYTDDCLYINRDNSQFICEWMIVHELIHAISYYTHNCSIEDEEFAFNLFNEVLTAMITSSLNPKINNQIQSGYRPYYDLLYPYINLMGESTLEAYFYGYDIIYKQIPKEELEFFVIVIQNYGAENSDVYYNNLIYKWYAK